MKSEIVRCTVVAGWTLALVTGCSSLPSVGPSYEEPELDVPASPLPDAGLPTTNLTAVGEYVPAEGAEDSRQVLSKDGLERWWERFGDSVLDDLVEGGISNNVSYRMAQRRLEQARYELLGSYAVYLPQFSVGAEWTRHWHNVNSSGNGNEQNGFNYNAQDVALNGNWEIDVFGGSRRATEAAFALAQAAECDVANEWLKLTTQIVSSYVDLRTTQERIAVARTNLVLQSETYDILKSRLDSGIDDELAVNQCAYVVEQTRARIPGLLAQEEASKNALAILAGAVPGVLHAKLEPLTDRHVWLLDPQKVAELRLDLMRGRPDVRAAERSLAAQTAQIGVAKSLWFPKLYVSGAVGWDSRDRAKIFTADSFFASSGPAVRWPIFQGGAVYAKVKAAEAKTAEVALAYELALQKAYGEVRSAYSAYTQEYHHNKALQSAVKAATDAVAISKDLYKNGLKDFNNVLDAQRSRLDFEEQFVVSRGQITIALIDLYRALGGGLAAETPQDEKDAPGQK